MMDDDVLVGNDMFLVGNDMFLFGGDLYLFRNVLCRDLHYCISLHISAPSSPTQIAKTLVAE